MIELRNFISLNENELKELLKWRNSVGNFMKTQNISLKEHLNFVKSLKNDASRRYFVVFKGGQSIGVIHLFNISLQTCEFGLYAKPNLRGVGQLLMNEVLNYAFDTLKVQILKACVFKTNERALTLYLKNDFKIINEDETMLYLCKRGGGGGNPLFLQYLTTIFFYCKYIFYICNKIYQPNFKHTHFILSFVLKIIVSNKTYLNFSGGNL